MYYTVGRTTRVILLHVGRSYLTIRYTFCKFSIFVLSIFSFYIYNTIFFFFIRLFQQRQYVYIYRCTYVNTNVVKHNILVPCAWTTVITERRIPKKRPVLYYLLFFFFIHTHTRARAQFPGIFLWHWQPL